MGSKSSIEWTEATWNPTVGCRRVSEGCRHCYAETMASRIANAAQAARRAGKDLTPTEEAYSAVVKWERGGNAAADAEDKALPRWNGQVRFVPERLEEPLRWTKPRRVFVDSMTDLFHEDIADEQIAAVFGVMAAARRHTFQVLTKRPRRALQFFEWLAQDAARFAGGVTGDARPWAALEHASGAGAHRVYSEAESLLWPLPNVWLGVSVEDQASADERVPLLLQLPAAVRFLSCEPLLGPVNLDNLIVEDGVGTTHLSCLDFDGDAADDEVYGGSVVDWVIVGGESGPRARPCDLEWVVALRDQCQAAGVPVFIKQLGDEVRLPCRDFEPDEWGGKLSYRCVAPDDYSPAHDPVEFRVGPKSSDWDHWREDLKVRQWPRPPAEGDRG